MAFLLALAGTLAAEAFVLRRLRFDLGVIALVLTSTLLDASYLRYTSIDERNYDGSSHLQYIQTIAESGRLPRTDECGPCGHPPAYYLVAAAWSKLGSSWAPHEMRLQWLSLLLFFGFVVVTLLILRSCRLPPGAVHLATALIAFWPSSVINSIRVHNDALASLSMLTAIYFTARWDARGHARDFYAALAASALALLTKATGYAVAATLLAFAVVHWRGAEPGRRNLKPLLTAMFVLSTAALLPLALRDARRPRTPCQQVLGSACDGRYVPPVADRPSRFVYFDPVEFVRRQETRARDPNRDYFFNRFAKSSLFGVMPLGEDFGGRRRAALAAAMSVALLAMVAFYALSLPSVRAADLRKYRVYLASCAILLLLLIAFRVRAPNEFHEDFRHIFPALVPFCLGHAALVERARSRSKLLYAWGLSVAVLMVAASVAFFVRAP